MSFWPLQGHMTRPPGLHQVRVMDERWGLLEGWKWWSADLLCGEMVLTDTEDLCSLQDRCRCMR